MVIPMRRLRRLMLATLFSGLATALFIAPLYADTNVDFTATVQKDTCQIEIDGNGTCLLYTSSYHRAGSSLPVISRCLPMI